MCQSISECDEYIWIFEYFWCIRILYSNIHSYQNFDTNIFGYLFVSKKFIQIYSDIHSCHFIDTNIFGYSFVSKSIRMSHSVLVLIEPKPAPCWSQRQVSGRSGQRKTIGDEVLPFARCEFSTLLACWPLFTQVYCTKQALCIKP